MLDYTQFWNLCQSNWIVELRAFLNISQKLIAGNMTFLSKLHTLLLNVMFIIYFGMGQILNGLFFARVINVKSNHNIIIIYLTTGEYWWGSADADLRWPHPVIICSMFNTYSYIYRVTIHMLCVRVIQQCHTNLNLQKKTP